MRNTDVSPTRRLGSRQRAVVCYIKILFTFIQDLQVYAGVLKISIKFLSYALSLCFVSRSLISSTRPLSCLSSCSVDQRGWRFGDDPSFRTDRRVSIVERSTRHASSRDACDVNEGRFYYFVPLFVVNFALTRYNRRFFF